MTLLTALFALTVALYVAAWAAQAAFLVRGSESVGRAGAMLLAPAALAHVAFLAVSIADGGARLGDIHQVLAFGSLLLVLAFLATAYAYRSRLPRVSVLGAFITPIALLFILLAAFHRGVGTVPEDVRSYVLPIHIVVNVLGETAFALAFAVAIAYVLQERQLKRKQPGRLFSRLPSLELVDRLGWQLSSWGFVLLTLVIVTGSFVTHEVGLGFFKLDPKSGFALLAWGLFAASVQARLVAGWRGRRIALLVVVGFVLLLFSYVGLVTSSPIGIGGARKSAALEYYSPAKEG